MKIAMAVVAATILSAVPALAARLLAQEEQDGRFATPEAKAGQNNGRTYFANMHRFDLKDAQHWMEKQVYLALGTLLLGAAALEIDACPIEGFDVKLLNDALDLRGKGFTAVALVALGVPSGETLMAAAVVVATTVPVLLQMLAVQVAAAQAVVLVARVLLELQTLAAAVAVADLLVLLAVLVSLCSATRSKILCHLI